MRTLMLLTLIGCSTNEAEREHACDALCDELVMTCGYTAYPTRESCAQGCLWDAENGKDIGAEFQCVQAAACDTFTILECEHGS